MRLRALPPILRLATGAAAEVGHEAGRADALRYELPAVGSYELPVIYRVGRHQLIGSTGDRVTQGQVIGTIGTTGRSTGPHLHWGLNWGQDYLDPATIVGPMPGQGTAAKKKR